MDFFSFCIPHKARNKCSPGQLLQGVDSLCMKVSSCWNTENINTIKAVSMPRCVRGRDCALFSCLIPSYVKPKESLQSGLWSMVVTNVEFKVCWRPFVYKSLTILPMSVYYIQEKSQPVLPTANLLVPYGPVVSSISPLLLEPQESYLNLDINSLSTKKPFPWLFSHGTAERFGCL